MKTASFCFNSICNNDSFVCSKKLRYGTLAKVLVWISIQESVTLTDGKLTTNEGCATISDKDGNYFFMMALLFTTKP
jgi:hypothetical protein